MTPETWQRLRILFHGALDLEPSERAEFLAASCNDNNIRDQVERLLASHEKPGVFLVSQAMITANSTDQRELGADDDERTGHRIGPYEIIRKIGHGGMGTVFLAVRADDQYRKHVAIKLVKRGMDTDTILRRFMMERQILARLEHQNIARLLEGGSTADGLPYFVMEYVEGEPIDVYCDTREFTIIDRLKLFRVVCSALQYAHQNLVVHRDIKPSNILVTAEGVPKLLDFGIAKLLGPDWAGETGEATASMVRLMTPEYASPEQFRGLSITTSSDVYSLGLVLYELLSGHHPYRLTSRHPEEIANVILHQDPQKPSSVRRRSRTQYLNTLTDREEDNPPIRLPDQKRDVHTAKALKGDLDNIVLKALRKDPDRRYASVHQFSEDIRRHLEGMPVTASPDTLRYRAGKFVQRHKAGVLAAAIVVVTLLMATVVTTWQASIARRERDKAERRFNQVRKLANVVLFEYHDGIQKLPGSTPIREKMVNDALEYLDNLSKESSGDPALQSELAAAYEKVGDVQGNPYGANLGNQDGALESYKKSLAIREALFAASPTSYQTRTGLAKSYERIGDISWAKGQSTVAEASYRKALTICDQLSKEGHLADSASFSRLYNRIGETQEQAGNLKGGLASYQQELKASEDLVAIEPTNAIFQTAVSTAYVKIGDIFFQLDDFKQASESYQKCLPLFQKLSADDRTNTSLRRKVVLVLSRLALAKMETGDLAKAIECNLQAIASLKEIFAADPNNAQIEFNFADILGNLAEAYGRIGNFASAQENFREALSQFKKILSANPNYAQVRSHFANSYRDYAAFLLKSGNTAAALENFRQALTMLEAANDKNESNRTLAEVFEGIADAEVVLNKKAGDLSEAKTMYQRSLAVWIDLQQRAVLPADCANKPAEVKEKIDECQAAPRRTTNGNDRPTYAQKR